MIARLNGKVLEKHPNRVIVDVVRRRLRRARAALDVLRAAAIPARRSRCEIHTHVREDQLALYGFATELELVMFEKLIAVSGIGPKLALSVLSGIEPRDLAGAILRNDLARLTAIPGVGKKTAERICVELRDRLPKTDRRRRRRRPRIRCVKISSRRSPISATIGRRSTRCSTSCSARQGRSANSRTCCGRR